MPTKRPFIWAHRGASGYERDNSMLAFEKAIELGADGIETDIIKTSDDQVVLSHDGSVTFGGQKYYISSLTLDILRKLPQDQKVFTFSELLDFALPRKIPVSVDVRDLETIQELLTVIETRQAFHSVEICLDSVHHLKRARGLSSSAVLVFSPAAAWFSHRAVELLKKNLDLFKELGVKAINFNWKLYVDHPELISLIKNDGKMLAYAWDVHLKNSMRNVIPLNLDAIYTNFPDRLRAFYEPTTH